jgi:outer membrane lipase/esterase
MKQTSHNYVTIVATSIIAFGLTACGGDTSTNPAGITSVRVFGDSLADTGTFGFKFTVNNAGVNGASTPIWPELVAKQLQVPSVCNFYTASANLGGAIQFSNNKACKNFAVGGARINNLSNGNAALVGTNTPASLAYQMDSAAINVQGKFPANELILLDGGGNDAADLATAYLLLASNAAGNKVAYSQLLSTMLPANIVNGLINVPASSAGTLNGAQQLGALYMAALANKLADDMYAKLLAKGASKVAVLNVPAITSTPHFQSALKKIASSSAGTKGAAGFEVLVRSWIKTFNQTLQARFSTDKRVVMIDLFAGLDRQLLAPGAYGLSNPINPITGVVDTACTIMGSDALGLPTYSFATCTAQNLDKTSKVNTWRKQSFSDGFHPTPYAHNLMAQLTNRTLAVRAWM